MTNPLIHKCTECSFTCYTWETMSKHWWFSHLQSRGENETRNILMGITNNLKRVSGELKKTLFATGWWKFWKSING